MYCIRLRLVKFIQVNVTRKTYVHLNWHTLSVRTNCACVRVRGARREDPDADFTKIKRFKT